ncbi:MAG TPA: transglycosylase SLT domain-containing protein [Noviherbaspirillum sp.]|nr:transglycosylase SLT domain-containing protein [Noviherbaspirillum sp.]
MLVPGAYANPRSSALSSDDEVFLALREASRTGNATRAAELAGRLGNYAIPSYVDYYRLRPRIHLASEMEIRDFLARYQGSAIADRLRNDWLIELGRARNWTLFDEQYPQFVLNDDTQVRCYALMSRALRNQPVAGEARSLLVAPVNYGEGCTALVVTLVENRQFSADDAWAQVRRAADASQLHVLRRLAPATGVAEATLTQAYEKPDPVVTRGPGKDRASREVFILALGRAARANPQKAADALNKHAGRLSKSELAIAWSQVALQASLKLAPEAIEYWRRTAGAPLSEDGYQWKARIALRSGDWTLVRDTIYAMPATLRTDATWIYWLGRAYAQEGKKEMAEKMYASIANQNSFYGKLALEELGRPITVPPRAAAPSAEELAPMAQNEGFKRALKFFDMNLRFEGIREWNWELRGMSERQHLAAAEFARQREVLDRMVSTSDRTRSEFDFTQRFPAPFREVMVASTEKLGLDMAWVYGLIRQESRFILNARSHVGASGLMQLMPGTAQYVARKIGLGNFRPSQVNELETNITLGTNYLHMVLQDLDGSQALATAAYNAGPGRPRAWRSTLPGQVEGAIFAESIPFSETRDYVKKVLSNATYYAALFEDKPQSLKARLGMVAPRDFVPSELP